MPVAKLEGYVWDLQFGQDGRYFASASMEEVQADASGDGAGYSQAAGQIDENSSAETYNQITMAADTSNVAIWDAELLEKVGDLDGAREVYKWPWCPESEPC